MYAFLAYSVPRETAEDLTSLTFERVLKAWTSFDPSKASERTWILTIARNALADHYRRQRLRATVSTDAHPALLDKLQSVDDPVADMIDRDEVSRWLALLSEREREVLAMRFGADLSAREVAANLSMSEANVHQVASRALRRLRQHANVWSVMDSDSSSR